MTSLLGPNATSLVNDPFTFFQVSPQLVIAYAIAGRIDIDFDREPLGYAYSNGSPVYLSEIWPSQKEVRQAEHGLVIPAIFRYSKCLKSKLIQILDMSNSNC